MKYFAYGANMHAPYLLEKIPGAIDLGAAQLKGYRLFFNKLSNSDKSGKSNVLQTRDPLDVVYGVLYDIPAASRYKLDKIEYLGYGTHDMTLKVYPVALNRELSAQEAGVFAFTYIAHSDRLYNHLRPFTWYKSLVIAGARAHNIPERYIEMIENHAAIIDPNKQREKVHAQGMAALLLS